MELQPCGFWAGQLRVQTVETSEVMCADQRRVKHTLDYHQAPLNCRPTHLTCRVNPLLAEAGDSDHEINAHQ